MLNFADTVILHKNNKSKICSLEFDHGKFVIKPKISTHYDTIANTLSDYVINSIWIKNYNLLRLPRPKPVTRRCCDGGRWINVGTTVYLIPVKGAKLSMLREYKTVLSIDHDIYENTVCINEDEAIRDIRSQMNIFSWIISKYIRL